jgi:transposase-like protein
MIDLSKDQLQDTITNVLNKEDGLNDLLQMVLNGLMKLERDTFLDKHASARNKANGYRPGRASGFGKELRLQIPRDRLGEFQPVLLALLRDQQQEVRQFCFELYGKGLTTRQIGEITDKIYGQHYSSSAISHFNQQLKEQLEAWRNRPLQARYPVLYIDAIHVKVRREHVSSEVFYVVLGLTETMQREVLAIVNIPSESARGWKNLLRQLKGRGLEQVGLVVADGLPGLDAAIHQVFPKARHQKCVTHFKRNVLCYVKAEHKDQVAQELREVFLTSQKAYTREQARRQFEAFIQRWGTHYRHIRRLNQREDLHYYFTYLDYNWRIQSMIYTTNWIERLNKSFRRSLKVRGALPNSEAALLLLSKVAVDQEDGKFQYPIYTFKFDDTLFPNTMT